MKTNFTIFFCITFVWLVSADVSGRPLSSDIDRLTADEMAPLALEDSMYYHFDEWFARFQAEINRLESAIPSKENRVELMKYYFNYAGLLAELTHTLAFTSKYQDTKIAADFIFYSNRVKDLAHEVLDNDTKSIQQEAEADLFLGAAEGYIGIFEYGQGNLLQALVNGFQADNHLEKALQLDPNLVDGYFGLGMYRYGNSRLGGVSNFIMQGGKDLRQLGLNHIEHAILKKATSLPLALKTLAWFYISEQINPENKELPPEHPLSQRKTRHHAWALLIELENRYFKGSAPHSHFKGNKEIAMMKALQYALDKDYTNAGSEFGKVLIISQHLKKRGFEVNPQLISSVEAGIKFCSLMLWEKQDNRNCLKVQEQIDFLKSGGSMVEYDSKKIRSELHAVFFEALQELTRKMNCGTVSTSANSEPF
jgi:tetratricopeptide (TPR) repeat protein